VDDVDTWFPVQRDGLYCVARFSSARILVQVSELPVGNAMTTKAGIWIDHRKAVIVTIDAGEERTTVLFSAVEKHPERAGDSPMHGRYEALQVPADDRRQRTLTKELNAYYDAVLAAVRRVESLLICGPGEAKGELRMRFEMKGLGARVAAVETEDKMTDRQFAAKTHQYFSDSAHHAS
jgi:hypothetical protein